MEYEAVIGLEVHAQLLTKAKVFCRCSTTFGAKPNTQTCPICIGMPGVLPVLNREALEYLLKLALATDCTIAEQSRFARKNYFYPDLPKGYQISQYEAPFATGGYVEINSPGGAKRIGLTRIHMEEDAGKLIHGENFKDSDSSYLDLNRAGVPLVEIVSEPDIRSPEDAREYLLSLKAILEYLEVCDCNMEEGSLRCDANVSIRPVGSNKLGVKTEVKNMNSFRNVQRALEYEIKRQMEVVADGGKIVQETRLWDADKGITLSMRSKEEAHDYRYFPEPDLVPTMVSREWIEEVRRSLPELPMAKRERFAREYSIPEYDAGVLTSSKPLADYYERCIALYPNPKIVSNWIMGDLLRELKNDDVEIDGCPVTPELLTDMLKLMDEGIISGKIAKTVFEEIYRTGKPPAKIVEEKGLVQITDESEVESAIERVMAENAAQVEDYRSGKERVFGFLVGQVMRATKGKANPKLVNDVLRKKLNSG